MVVAACPRDVQLDRLITRNQLAPDDAARRIDSQMPIDDKAARADYVIETSGSFADTDRQVRQVWARLSVGAPRRR